MENIQEDLEMIHYMGGLGFDKVNIRKWNESKGGSTQNFTRTLFSELDNELFENLYNLYKIDFEMFGYDPYMVLGQKSKWTKVRSN